MIEFKLNVLTLTKNYIGASKETEYYTLGYKSRSSNLSHKLI